MLLRTPTTRKPTRWCSRSDAAFSGKIDVCSVQMPALSLFSISRSISARPIPRPLLVARDVDARLRDAAVAQRVDDGAAGRPADHALVELGDDPDRMRDMPRIPRRNFGLERRHAAAHPVAVDRRDLRPVIGSEVADHQLDRRR